MSGPSPVCDADPAYLRRCAVGRVSGQGKAYAPIVWLYLLSKLRHGAKHRRCWPSNATISRSTGLPQRAVEAGLACLRRCGRVSASYGPRGRFHRGRVLALEVGHDGPNARVHLPSPETMAAIWRAARQVRNRPASLVALALALHVLAAAETGGPMDGASVVHSPQAALRELVDAAHGSTFGRRLDDLVAAGLIERVGTSWRAGVRVLPVCIVAAVARWIPAMPMRKLTLDDIADHWVPADAWETGPPTWSAA